MFDLAYITGPVPGRRAGDRPAPAAAVAVLLTLTGIAVIIVAGPPAWKRASPARRRNPARRTASPARRRFIPPSPAAVGCAAGAARRRGPGAGVTRPQPQADRRGPYRAPGRAADRSQADGRAYHEAHRGEVRAPVLPVPDQETIVRTQGAGRASAAGEGRARHGRAADQPAADPADGAHIAGPCSSARPGRHAPLPGLETMAFLAIG